MIIRPVEAIRQMYLERSDSLDASSYEVGDLCDEIIELRRQLAATTKERDEWDKQYHGAMDDLMRLTAELERVAAQRDQSVTACRELVATTQRAVVNNVFGVAYEVLPKAYGMCKAVAAEADAAKKEPTDA